MPDHWAGGLQVQGRSAAGLQAVVHAAHVPAAGAKDAVAHVSLLHVGMATATDA